MSKSTQFLIHRLKFIPDLLLRFPNHVLRALGFLGDQLRLESALRRDALGVDVLVSERPEFGVIIEGLVTIMVRSFCRAI